MNNFTIPETNIVCIYLGQTRMETIENIIDGLPLIDDPDMLGVIETTLDKLIALTDSEMADIQFMDSFVE